MLLILRYLNNYQLQINKKYNSVLYNIYNFQKMENSLVQKINVVMNDLQHDNIIQQKQKNILLKDLLGQQKLKEISKKFEEKYLKTFLKTYIEQKNNQSKEKRNLIKKQKITYNFMLQKKKSRRQSVNSIYYQKQKNIINKILCSGRQQLKDKVSSTTRFLSQMICNKKQKVIQNYLSKLLFLLLQTSEYGYIKIDKLGKKPRIQYYNSNLNYLTILLSNESKYNQIIKISQNLKQKQYEFNVDNKNLSNLFDIKTQNNANKYHCYIIDNQQYKILFLLRDQNANLTKNIKKNSNLDLRQLFSMFVQQAIQTLHNSKFDISNVQITVKSVLNLLLFTVKMNQISIQQQINGSLKQFLNVQNPNCIQYIKQLRNIGKNQDANMIQQLYQKFQQIVNKYQNKINLYKLEVTQIHSIYFDFNKYGELRFISNKLPSIFFKRIKQAKKSQSDQITIFDLFKKNSDVIQTIQNAMNGQNYTQPVQIYEDQLLMELKINYSQNSQISRLQLRIFSKESQRNKGSIGHFTSINTILSTDSEKQQKININEKIGINQNAKRLISQLQNQTPGAMKNGWIQAFMKNELIDKYKAQNILLSRKQIQGSYKKLNKIGKRISINQSLINNQMDLNVSQKILTDIDIQSFDMNILEIDQSKYFALIQTIFNQLKFYRRSNISRAIFNNFLLELKSKYNKNNNPFHNFNHGINVMHFCYLISKFPKNQNYLSDINKFALVFSGLCHDVGHPGNTNVFQINTQSKKAILYNDKSPLENYHASKSYKILLKQQNNFLRNLKKEEFNQIRKQFIANILATDIKQHFPLVANFQNKLKNPKGFQKTPADIQLLTTFIIHTSDFSGASKTFDLSRQWAERVNRQFSKQYQMEGKLGIAQTPHMKDLDKQEVMAKNEAGFMKVIVRPLYKNICDFYSQEESTKKILKNIDQNVLIWQKIMVKAKKKEQIKTQK